MRRRLHLSFETFLQCRAIVVIGWWRMWVLSVKERGQIWFWRRSTSVNIYLWIWQSQTWHIISRRFLVTSWASFHAGLLYKKEKKENKIKGKGKVCQNGRLRSVCCLDTPGDRICIIWLVCRTAATPRETVECTNPRGGSSSRVEAHWRQAWKGPRDGWGMCSRALNVWK